MLSFSLKPHTIEIRNLLIVVFKSSRRRYEIHLEEEKRKKQETKAEKKAMHIAADIDKLKVKRGHLERSEEMMESEFIDCIRLKIKMVRLMFIKAWTKEKKYSNKGQYESS